MPALEIETTPEGVVIAVKVVPGSRQDAIVGPLGGALKIKTAAAAEGGKANRAVCAMLAARLGIDRGDLTLLAGHTSPRKRIAVAGLDAAAVRAKLDA